MSVVPGTGRKLAAKVAKGLLDGVRGRGQLQEKPLIRGLFPVGDGKVGRAGKPDLGAKVPGDGDDSPLEGGGAKAGRDGIAGQGGGLRGLLGRAEGPVAPGEGEDSLRYLVQAGRIGRGSRREVSSLLGTELLTY